MDKRTLLAVVLSIAVIFIYQTFFVKPPVKTQQTSPAQQETTVAPQTAKTAPTKGERPAPPPPAIQTQSPTGRMIGSKAAVGTEQEVIVETPLYRAVFTTRGAAL